MGGIVCVLVCRASDYEKLLARPRNLLALENWMEILSSPCGYIQIMEKAFFNHYIVQ